MADADSAAPALPSPSEFLRLIGIGAVIGIPAAFVAVAFLAIVDKAEDWLWTDLPDALGQSEPPSYLVIGAPVVGALLVYAARRFLPGDGGHEPLNGIGGGQMAWRYGPGILLAAFGTLAFGAVLGPEAPLIGLGSVVGTAAVSLFKVKAGVAEPVLGTAGSFSAVSALFGGPLVAGMLLLEGGLAMGAALLPALIPGLVAAAIGYVIIVGIGDWGGIGGTTLSVPDLPAYDGTRIVDLLLAVVVGLVTAIVIAVIRKVAVDIHTRSKRSLLLGLLAGGLGVGLLAEVARLLGADSQEVLFSGQSGLPVEVATGSMKVLLIVLGAKALGYAISLGCGFRGGPVFPAIFLGTGVAMVAVIGFGVSPTWAVSVGAAAGMAAGTRLVFSSVLLASLLAGTAGIDAMPAAVLATVTAWMAMRAIDARFGVTTVEVAPAADGQGAAAPS